MKPRLSDEDREKTSEWLSSRQSNTIDQQTKVPLGWVLGAAGALIFVTASSLSLFHRMDQLENKSITVRYMYRYSKELEAKNPNMRVPDVYEIAERR